MNIIQYEVATALLTALVCLVFRIRSQNMQPTNRWHSLPPLLLSLGASGTLNVALSVWSCRYSHLYILSI